MVRATWGDAPSPVDSARAARAARPHRRSAWPSATRCSSRTSPPTRASPPRGGPGEPRHRSGALVAVASRQAIHGSLVALSHERRTFDPDEVSFVEALANVLAAALRPRAVRAGAHPPRPERRPHRSAQPGAAPRPAHPGARPAPAGSARLVGVLIVDIDRFKELNDAYGHEAGDRLLLEVAGASRSALGPDDTLARMGGDEFAVLCPSLTSIDERHRPGHRWRRRSTPAVHLDDVELFVTASIGIARARPARAPRPTRCCARPTSPCTGPRSRGRNRHEIFDERMRERAIRRLDTSTALRRALERDELRVV